MISKEEAQILKDCFNSVDGEKALAVLRRVSGYDSVLNGLKISEREECYALGRASVFNDVLKAMTQKKEKTNGKQSKSLSDEF